MSRIKIDDAFRLIVLRAEIAELLHDIGKFTRAFVLSKVTGNKKQDFRKYQHGMDFLEGDAWPRICCTDDLLQRLNKRLPDDWLRILGTPSINKLGDILRLHHSKDSVIRAHLNLGKSDPFPLPLVLAVMGDSLDSATSKGAGSAEWKDRRSRLDESLFNQAEESCFLATPFGEREEDLRDSQEIEKRAVAFQEQLANLLIDHNEWDLQELIQKRKELIRLMKEHLSAALAETRLPNNDVSLWQHSYSTASIFKAMLASHLLWTDPVADAEGSLLFYKEKLAILAVRWSEEDLLSRAVRPRDILGRRLRLLNLREALVEVVEETFTLGNRIYQDRDGVCFLIPSLQKEAMKDVEDALCDGLESVLNQKQYYPGDIHYEIRSMDVGIQILGLTEILSGKGKVLRNGPLVPRWMERWEKGGASTEVCSRCGVEPVELIGTSVGGEIEEAKVCGACKAMIEEGDALRHNRAPKAQVQLLGVPTHLSQYMTFMTDELIDKVSENPRLALVQGVFDLRHFLSGEAFSSLFARRPSDFSLDPTAKDKSLEMKTWEEMYNSTEKCWGEVKESVSSEEAVHTFQQLYQDTFLGTPRDGRVEGKPDHEKLRNYLREIVLSSAFPSAFSEIQKIMVYALRVHPAPSRIARVWETTEKLCREPVLWCEKNKVRYFPVSLDTGRFLILVPAPKAWSLLQAMVGAYQQSMGRVRHLLPFHLSVSVFSHKFPLYVGIDAMRKFLDLQLSRQQPCIWQLKSKQNSGGTFQLHWLDNLNRPVTWTMSAHTPNGGQEIFYTWFWPQEGRFPVSIQEIEANTRVSIWPSTFDYEVLDTTARRYDIHEFGERGRPHVYCGAGGPRPYPLEDLELWEANGEIQVFKSMEHHQMNRLIGFLGGLHAEWKGCAPDVFGRQAGDYLRLCLEERKDWPTLQRLAATGALFDVYEWTSFINK